MKFGDGVCEFFFIFYLFFFFLLVCFRGICASVEKMLRKLSKCDNGDCACNGGYNCTFCNSAITKQFARKESAIKHLEIVYWKHYSSADSISTSSYQIVHKNKPKSGQIDSRYIQHYHCLCLKRQKAPFSCKNKQMEFIEETEDDSENEKDQNLSTSNRPLNYMFEIHDFNESA